MKTINKGILSFLSLVIIPFSCFAQQKASFFHTGAEILTYINYILVITSILSIKQYFRPGDNKTVFHIANLICVILFYLISLSFLINNKVLYDGYETLSPIGCIGKVFFSMDFYTLLQWVIVSGFVINILYIVKYRKDFYYNQQD